MTREVAHYQMFEAALATIQPNFPPGVFQSDPRHSNTYYNMSQGQDGRGPWNQGSSSQLGEAWQYIEDPLKLVRETDGLSTLEPTGTDRTDATVAEADETLGAMRSEEIKSATPIGSMQWSDYNQNKSLAFFFKQAVFLLPVFF